MDRALSLALIQITATIVLPYTWARFRLGKRPADLGLNLRRIPQCTLLACGLYVLALAAFMHCSADPVVANHPVRSLGPGKAVELGASMCLIAAGTDIASRGFILLALASYTPLPFAIAMQNAFWLLGHTNEIRLLSPCLGVAGAVGLFLILGLGGDAIALRTRNVVGLAVAHMLLNVGMILYIRQL